MFSIGILHKHKNNTDIAFLVRKSYFIAEKDLYKLNVTWYNICNIKNIFRISDDKIQIKRSDIKNWTIYEPTEETT